MELNNKTGAALEDEDEKEDETEDMKRTKRKFESVREVMCSRFLAHISLRTYCRGSLKPTFQNLENFGNSVQTNTSQTYRLSPHRGSSLTMISQIVFVFDLSFVGKMAASDPFSLSAIQGIFPISAIFRYFVVFCLFYDVK